MSSGSTNSQQRTQTVRFAFCYIIYYPSPILGLFLKIIQKKGEKTTKKRYLGKYSLDINGQVSMGTSIPPYNTKSQSIRAFLQSNNLRLRCSENTINITQISNVCLWGLYAKGTLTETFIWHELFFFFFTQSQTMTLALNIPAKPRVQRLLRVLQPLTWKTLFLIIILYPHPHAHNSRAHQLEPELSRGFLCLH